MKQVHRRQDGLSIVEVLIAIVILAVGVLSLIGLQTSSLSTNRRAQVLNQLTRLATSELELRRQTVSVAGSSTCKTQVPSGFVQGDCGVVVEACGISIVDSSTTELSSRFSCAGDLPFAVYRATVTASGRGDSITLSSLYGGFYVSGRVSGTASTPQANGGNE